TRTRDQTSNPDEYPNPVSDQPAQRPHRSSGRDGNPSLLVERSTTARTGWHHHRRGVDGKNPSRRGTLQGGSRGGPPHPHREGIQDRAIPALRGRGPDSS